MFETQNDSVPANGLHMEEQLLERQREPSALLRLTKLTDNDYNSMQWKNGLGRTQEIWVAPEGADFKELNFRWRLSKAHISSSCSFSYFPGYQNTIVLLPFSSKSSGNLEQRQSSNPGISPVLNANKLSKDSLNQISSTIKLRHSEECVTHVLKPLVPYTYLGNWATSCDIPQACWDLTFMAKKDSVRGEVSVETIEHELSFRRLCLVSQAVIYVVHGKIKVIIDEKDVIVSEGETLLIEKSGLASPRWIVIDHVPEKNSVTSKIVFIQVHENIDDETFKKVTKRGSIILDKAEPLLTLLPTLKIEDILPEGQHESVYSFHEIPATSFYQPPPWSLRYQSESVVPPASVTDRLDIEKFPRGTVSCVWIRMMKQGLSDWISVPCIIARGQPMGEEDEVVGITAALHGNEVNGVNSLQRLMSDLDVSKLRGTVVAVLCLNIPGYLNFKREFSDGRDLNRHFPGRPEGYTSQVYCHLVMEKIIQHFTYLIDLHTASFGRENSYYVRADLNQPRSALMARLQQPQIILHNSGQDGTMRSAAAEKGVHAITVEIGNPQTFQAKLIQWTQAGILNVLNSLGMYPLDHPIIVSPETTPGTLTSPPHDSSQPNAPVLCSKGFWVYTRTGGVLEVYPTVNTFVKKGQLVARVMNIFGNTVDEYTAACDAMVIGKSSNPVASSGDR